MIRELTERECCLVAGGMKNVFYPAKGSPAGDSGGGDWTLGMAIFAGAFVGMWGALVGGAVGGGVSVGAVVVGATTGAANAARTGRGPNAGTLARSLL
jgi:hypothetical protein